MKELRAGTKWVTGGCYDWARAALEAAADLGLTAKLVGVFAAQSPQPDHLTVKVGTLYFDGLGAHTRKALLSTWQRELRTRPVLREIEEESEVCLGFEMDDERYEEAYDDAISVLQIL